MMLENKGLKKLKVLILTLLLCMVSSLPVFAAGNLTTVKVSGMLDYDMASEVLQFVNQNRKENGLGALTMNAYLQEAAMQRAMELAVLYSHTRPNGEECFSAINPDYASTYKGENIAIGYHTSEEVMEGWMKSPGHRANILNEKFTQIGVGCYYRGRGNYWDGNYCWVQMFGNGSGDILVKTDCVFEKRSISVLADNLHLRLYWTEQDVMPYPLDRYSLNEGAAIQTNVFTYNQWDYMMLDSESFEWSTNSPCLSVGPDGMVVGREAGGGNVIATLPDQSCQTSVALTVNHVKGAPATCTTPESCEVCGKILTEAIGHKAGAAPTCTEPQTCTVCGAVIQEALGHDYMNTIIAPTEAKYGYTLHVCCRCKDSYKDHYILAEGFPPNEDSSKEEGSSSNEGFPNTEEFPSNGGFSNVEGSSSNGGFSNKDDSSVAVSQKIQKSLEIQKKLKKPLFASVKRKSGTKAVAKWKKVAEAEGYELQISTRPKKGFKRIAKISAKKNSYVKKGLSKNKVYYFRVRAYKKVAGKYYYSAWSKVKKLK